MNLVIPSKKQSKAIATVLRLVLSVGRPVGGEQFVENLEERCGRRLRARPVGRPKKASDDEGDQLSFEYGV